MEKYYYISYNNVMRELNLGERIELSSRAIYSYRVNPHIEGELQPGFSPFSNPLVRTAVDYIFTRPLIGLDKPSHTGEFVNRPKHSLPPTHERPRIPADPEAFPIIHWWDWLRMESRWGWENHVVVGLDLEQFHRSQKPPQRWHLAHTYDDVEWISRWTGIIEHKQLVRIGRGPKDITLLAVDTQGQELPLQVIAYINRHDPYFRKVPWI